MLLTDLPAISPSAGAGDAGGGGGAFPHLNGGAPKTVKDWQAMQEARLQDASAETRAKRRDHENDEARRAERLQQNMLNEGRAKLN